MKIDYNATLFQEIAAMCAMRRWIICLMRVDSQQSSAG